MHSKLRYTARRRIRYRTSGYFSHQVVDLWDFIEPNLSQWDEDFMADVVYLEEKSRPRRPPRRKKRLYARKDVSKVVSSLKKYRYARPGIYV